MEEGEILRAGNGAYLLDHERSILDSSPIPNYRGGGVDAYLIELSHFLFKSFYPKNKGPLSFRLEHRVQLANPG